MWIITECAVNFTKTQNTKGYTSQKKTIFGSYAHANKSKLIHSDCTMLHAISFIVHLTSKKWMNHVSISTKKTTWQSFYESIPPFAVKISEKSI